MGAVGAIGACHMSVTCTAHAAVGGLQGPAYPTGPQEELLEYVEKEKVNRSQLKVRRL